jgi:hypothetical protein
VFVKYSPVNPFHASCKIPHSEALSLWPRCVPWPISSWSFQV